MAYTYSRSDRCAGEGKPVEIRRSPRCCKADPAPARHCPLDGKAARETMPSQKTCPRAPAAGYIRFAAEGREKEEPMLRKLVSLLTVLTLLIVPLGLAEEASIGGADGPTSIFVAGELTDGLGRTVEIPETVEKVVSLTAANTEIVYALGAGDLLVGADAYSDYPEEANALPRMGDYAGPNVELIAAAEADVVLASTKLQQDAIEKMEALGLNVVCVEPTGLDELYEGIALIAAVVGADPTPLLTKMQDAIAETASAVPADMEPVRVYFALSFGESGDFSAGPGTFIDELIAMAGGENVAAGSEYAWPMYSLEGIVAADPDVILVSDYGDGTAVEQFCALSGYGELRAVQEGHVYALTDDLISRPGPRIAEGFQQVVDALADAGAYD